MKYSITLLELVNLIKKDVEMLIHRLEDRTLRIEKLEKQLKINDCKSIYEMCEILEKQGMEIK